MAVNYHKQATNKLLDSIARLTGIDRKKLDAIAEKEGTSAILDRVDAVDCTKAQKVKLHALKVLISEYNEVMFLREKTLLDSSTACGNYFIARLKGKSIEQLDVCLLDNQNRIITTKTLSTGTVNESAVYPREVAKFALLNDATSLLLAHNHPGGSLQPSHADIKLTEHLKATLDTLKIRLLDHIIVGDDRYSSFAEKGLVV